LGGNWGWNWGWGWEWEWGWGAVGKLADFRPERLADRGVRDRPGQPRRLYAA
jgi:hypothetical protein